MNRKELLKERDKATSKERKIPLVLTYSHNINILSISKTFK